MWTLTAVLKARISAKLAHIYYASDSEKLNLERLQVCSALAQKVFLKVIFPIRSLHGWEIIPVHDCDGENVFVLKEAKQKN